MTTVTIEKRSNFKSAIHEAFSQVYTDEKSPIMLNAAKYVTKDIAQDYEYHSKFIGRELDFIKKLDMINIRLLIEGKYYFDCGDFTYYVEINE